jgi:serine/threonine-protein kinase
MGALTDTDWDELDRLFDEALDRPPEERSAFLDRACEGRPRLRRELESLLAAEAASEGFLEQEAVSFAAPAYDPEEGESIADDPLAAPAHQVGPYRLEEEIGRGGMSRVFRAVRADGGFDQTVAVKLLRMGLDTEAARRRFRLEQQVLAKLQHPNIAALLDGGLTADDTPYLVMEYVDGRPLTAYCDEEELPLPERLDLLRDVGRALQHAHRNLVVHRDLKPSNVLVTAAGTVKLLDFGIAKLLDETEASITLPQTRTGVRPMTPAYAAPEQVRGDAVSTATDVYQIGVLAYEVLTGHRPFEEAPDGRAIEQAILETSPQPPSTVVGDPRPEDAASEASCPTSPTAISAARNTTPRQLRHQLEGDLDTIMQTAMRKEEERRYASVEALLGDLERYREGQPIEARSASLRYRAGKFLQRHRWGVGIAVVFLGLVVTFGALVVQQRERAEREAQKAELVSSYLVDLFSAGTSYGPADTVTARTLVRRGLDRVERLRDRPVVQAEMLDALGQASRGLGEWEQADSLLQRALTLRRRHLSPPHPDLVASLLHVADTRWSGRRFWEAQPLYEEALSMSRQLPLGVDRHRAQIMEGLAKTMSMQGAPDSAEVLMRRAIDLRRRQQGGQYHGLSLDQMDLARIVQRQGQHDEAEDLYRAGLRKMESGTGYTDPERVTAYKNFGDLLRKKGENAAAATYYRRAIRITVAEMGTGHPRARRARDNLYKTLLERGRHEQALAVARTNLEVLQKRHPPSHPAIPTAYQRVGHLLDNMGRSTEAEPLLQRAVRLQARARGQEHIWTHNTQVRHALCLVEQGRGRRAEPMLDDGRRVLRQTPADSTTVDLTRMRAILRVGEGRLHAQRGQWADAATDLERGYYLRRRQVGLRAPLSQRALRALVDVYGHLQRPDRAAAYRDSLMVR